ncbi:MAG: hypothetical protein JSU86_06555 [Phycisphaerales bacterium]|nr:MAG: hypothetical protein JSU86_06555 [Phycisphaerales bacterium]
MVALDLYNAINTRFKQSARLVRSLRRCYFGVASEADRDYLPCVLVHIDETEDLSTYDEEVRRFTVDFEIRTKVRTPQAASEAIRYLQAMFDNVEFDASSLSLSGWNRNPQGGETPTSEGGVYKARVQYDVIAASRAKSPAFEKR